MAIFRPSTALLGKNYFNLEKKRSNLLNKSLPLLGKGCQELVLFLYVILPQSSFITFQLYFCKVYTLIGTIIFKTAITCCSISIEARSLKEYTCLFTVTTRLWIPMHKNIKKPDLVSDQMYKSCMCTDLRHPMGWSRMDG